MTTPDPAAPAQQTPPAPQQDDADDPNVLRRELAEARREAARYRTAARDATAQQTAALTDAEKATKALADREAALTARELAALDRDNRSTVSAAATALGFRDPRDAYALVRDDLTLNDDGTVKNPDRALRDLLKDKPYLGGTASADAGEGRGAAAAGQSFNDAIRTAAGKR